MARRRPPVRRNLLINLPCLPDTTLLISSTDQSLYQAWRFRCIHRHAPAACVPYCSPAVYRPTCSYDGSARVRRLGVSDPELERVLIVGGLGLRREHRGLESDLCRMFHRLLADKEAVIQMYSKTYFLTGLHTA